MHDMTIEEIRNHLSDVRARAEHHRDLSTTALLLLRDALSLSEFDILQCGGCEDCATLGPELCGCGEYDYSAPKDPKERLEFFAKRRLAAIVRQLAQNTGIGHLGIETALVKLYDHTKTIIDERAERLAANNKHTTEPKTTKTKKPKTKRTTGGKS